MFKDIDWKGAVRRAALTVLIYLGLIYVLNVALPGTSTGIVPTIINAAILFVIFTFFHGFVERRKKRQKAALRSTDKDKKTKNRSTAASGTEEDDGGVNLSKDFKGRQNPNTSRRKASRRRR